MQEQIAEHNSAYDTLKDGKQVSYVAACDLARERDRPVALVPKAPKQLPPEQPAKAVKPVVIDADKAGRTG